MQKKRNGSSSVCLQQQQEEKKEEQYENSSNNNDLKPMEESNPNVTRLPDVSVTVSEGEKISSHDDDRQPQLQQEETNNNSISSPDRDSIRRSPHFLVRFLCLIIRVIILDLPLTILFSAVVGMTILHTVHDKYLVKQLDMMRFQVMDRPLQEHTYYERECHLEEEISARSRDELILPKNSTAEECVAHQMTHGVSIYQDLLTPNTIQELREFILQENSKRRVEDDEFGVIENEYRYSWGVDINMVYKPLSASILRLLNFHPSLQHSV